MTDPDSESKAYLFSVADQEHCACFNIGEGQDGSPLISWSDMMVLYQLPDGTKWAEHGSLYDTEDLVIPVSSLGQSLPFAQAFGTACWQNMLRPSLGVICGWAWG